MERQSKRRKSGSFIYSPYEIPFNPEPLRYLEIEVSCEVDSDLFAPT